MKNLKYIIYSLMSLFVLATGCKEDDATFGDIIAPTNLVFTIDIVGQDINNPFGDGSGIVNFTATADNALSYNIQFGNSPQNTTAVSPTGAFTNQYTSNGVNTYTVVVSAVGTGGVTTLASADIEVLSDFTDPDAILFLTGGPGASKTWYPKLDQDGHLGVGPTLEQDLGDDGALNGHWFPQYDSTGPFGKCGNGDSDCFCNFNLTFSQSLDEQVTFTQNNNGFTFFNWAHGAVVGQTFGEFSDTCWEFDTSGVSEVTLAPSSTDWTQVADPNYPAPRGTVMNLTNDGFMGYYTGASTYEILQIDESFLYVRFQDAINPVLVWYQMFTTTEPGEEFSTIFNNLTWSDEFDTNGAPDSNNWTYDLGAGGWGNQEVQTYTNNAENVIVEDGFLKITAKENGGGYTSARLKSEGLFNLTYGRVEVRAKLPASIGTWPAIWMLGADYQTNTWPGCGEIDIMEQKGQDKNRVLATVHHPAVSPGAGDSADTILTTSTTEFHNYTVEWRTGEIIFLVDDTIYHTVTNTSDLPFNSEFFLILNIAMGGTLGGDIDPAFTEDTMEIDYVRVYQ
ncbi:family 16 glycosylhydrolase [Psychroserpens sp.]|uniref:glycoside hydrolase family 16 protein n=1 Tax=Psychroserpens sp. TaxID=2020870 RepID=UPI00385938EC